MLLFRRLYGGNLTIRSAEPDVSGDDRMRSFWTRSFLTRRIDRCYLIAAAARIPEKRRVHLELARHYRQILASLADHPSQPQPA